MKIKKEFLNRKSLSKYGFEEKFLYGDKNIAEYWKKCEYCDILIQRRTGEIAICTDTDGDTFDIDNCKRKLQKNLNINYQNVFLEYHYKYIKPHIMVEEYLDDGVNINPYDYKFYCFNGTVHSILVCSNRENTLKFNDFDKNWNELKYTKQEYRGSKEIKKPSNLDKMIKIAQQLSSPFPFVRIDLYNINGKIYFGEFTFSPSAGLKRYYTQEALDILGDKLDLSLYN